MSRELFRCPLCGSRFDAQANAACLQCPLTKNCPMVCCPTCGHVTLDPGRSILGRLAREALGSQRSESGQAHG